MKVEIVTLVDGEECELTDLPSEYLAGIELECRNARLSKEKQERAYKLIAKRVNENV